MLRSEDGFMEWLFGLERFYKILIQVIFDGLVASVVLLIAFYMRLEDTAYFFRVDTYIGLFIAVITTISVFAASGQYNNVTRYISTETAYKLAIGSALSCAFLLSSILLLELEMPRSVPLIFGTLLCLAATATRLFVRVLSQRIIKQNMENIAIFGTSAESVQLMEALRKDANYHVSLLIDDSVNMIGKKLGGVEICDLSVAKKKFKKLEIKILLIAAATDFHLVRMEILEELSDHPLIIKTIPSISSLISGETKISDLKDIKIEDLLGRKTAEHIPELMAKNIAGKTVFVTGAGGSIGSELCRQIILWKPQKLILLDISEYSIYKLLKELDQHQSGQRIELVPLIGSVQDSKLVKRIFDRFVVDTTYHAAAYKHVPLMEQNVMQCFANNVFGTLNVAEFAIAANVKNFVLVSTDKAVNPSNFMGASKRFSELICQTLPTKKVETCFSIVRFGNVLGSSGSVVPLFKKQIESGGPITLTHPDITRYFMTISEASQLVIQAGALGKSGDVFVLDMGEPIKILELAKRMIYLAGLTPVLNNKDRPKDDEIAVNITGLRPGEKLFEELAYSPNLTGTVHPKIQTTAEKPMKREKLQALLVSVENAIQNNDDRKLHNVISAVTTGVPSIADSIDLLLCQGEANLEEITPPSRQDKF